MTLETLVSKYVGSAKQVLELIEIVENPMIVETKEVEKVVSCARDYLMDAEYYMEKEKFEVSLTSVAYCEGLLDALRLLGAVKFEWPESRNDAK